MKVKDLLTRLNTFAPESDVICYCEDENPVLNMPGSIIFEITSVSSVEAQKGRNEGGVPFLKFNKTEYSEPHVLIEITSDF